MTPLVGRAAELAEIRSVLAAAARGTGGCVVLEGPAGIGKSRLVAAMTQEALELGVAVAAGRATEADRVAPLTTLVTALQGAGPPVLDSADLAGLHKQADSRFWLVSRLGELIEEYVCSRTLLIVLDDAQWADEYTALMLRILVPRLSSSPVLWVLAGRPLPEHSPGRDALDWLVAEGARRLQLGPLSDDAVAELCEKLLGATPDPGLLTFCVRSASNPFLLEELLTSLRGDGRVLVSGGTATAAIDELPDGFLTAVAKRLGDLSVDARRLLEAGAVLGRPFTVHEVAGLRGRPAVQLVGAVEEAVHAGVLVERNFELVFRHDLIREAVYDRLSGPVRRTLHREAATVLQAEGRSAAEIASHLVCHARKGDEQALSVLQDAVKEVAPTAPGTAADLALQMLDLLGQRERSRPRLIADAVRLLASAGRLVEARKLGETALHGELDASAEAATLLGLAEALTHAGQDGTAVEYTRRALSRPDVPDRDQAELLAIQAQGLLSTADFASADSVGAQAAEPGGRAGVDAAVVSGTVTRSAALCARGHLDDAISLASEATRVAEASSGEARQRHPRLWLGRALVAADRFTEADAVYEIGQREAEELGTAWSLPLWHFYRAELRLAAGRLDDAAAEAEAGVRVSEQLSAWAVTPSLLAALGQIAMRHDDLVAARGYLDRAQRLVADAGGTAEDVTWELALFEDAEDRPEAALNILAGVYEAMPERLLLLVQVPWAGPHLVRIALSVDATEQAATAAAASRSLAELNPGVASLAGAAAHAEGLLRGDLSALRTAVQAYRCSHRRLATASALEDSARAENAAGHRSDAVRLWKEALGHYVDSGATRDERRVLDSLRRSGARGKSSSGRAICKMGWNSLTESELRVARLVAQGLTNRAAADRLFLSPHTVDSHLRHSFAKLDVSSRVELTRLVLAHDTDGDHQNTWHRKSPLQHTD